MARYFPFPLILGATIGLAIALLPHLGPPLTLVICETLGASAIAIGERLWPFRVRWNQSHGDVGTDLLHATVSGIGTTQLMRAWVQAGGVAIAGALSRDVGFGLWPSQWPLVLQLGLALVIVEFTQYWLHRLQHERDALWRFHAVHHSAPRLYWLNAARFHPIDIALLYIVGYVPLVALGCPEAVIMLFALFDAVFGMLQHSNIDVRLGPLNWIFSMAEPHRWHHSRTLEEANTNYGSNLMIWDVAFGTFFLPGEREPPQNIGIANMPDFPMTYLAQLASPFTWRRLSDRSDGSVRSVR
jgi:sterol desaturase/sphingolipid hydroxylase (fatty acid hydroxylase superfamily)